MAGNLFDLANYFESLQDKFREAASQAASQVAMAIIQDLANVTPVDTSNAVSNWLVSLDRPIVETITPHYPGQKGSTRRESAAMTVDNARYILAAKKPGQVIYITNNVPYIGALDRGSSRQAPAGFVARAILVGRNLIRRFKAGF